ncbi:acylneuraminate cytidylyltransferase family protein [Selenihalanaerobacter shriftii]|uniref:CMP-N,N'-diacetyllegionaminic acid synthase n=1 Tax=Selenihalanaerobacter shriftii TaxID=142842 RepID=A0A1T4KNF3_9FIRM|nr:acylneuraminate cytidylyltransferase family protein [Selenihalanaerobacter shriftii]SJZ43945.1 CMP-N,N'-diacetyllegionaminic acid synthase [Selenihalanaerobacter shriftii]
MFEGNQILAIILARGGSKGIPKKNIKELNGKPLIAYTIESAKQSRYIDCLVLSTDDEEIAEVGKQYGAEVPFIRPDELATDTAKSEDAIIHALNWLRDNEEYLPDYIMLLQPTSPLRAVEDINRSIEKLTASKADSLISICKTDKSPYWMKTINDEGYLEPVISEKKHYNRRQDLPDTYQLNGAIYIAKVEMFLKYKSFFTDKIVPYIMPRERSIDIDDVIDWKLIQLLLEEEFI